MRRIILILVVVASFIAFHELAHAEIFKLHGCENIGFGYTQDGLFSGFSTHGYNCVKDPTLANSINEIIGYCIVPYLILIMVILHNKEEE
jgi:hypothetical protein